MPVDSFQVGLTISRAQYRRLGERAEKLGYSRTGYANLIFQAAYAARVGQERELPPEDAELDEQVRMVMVLAGQGSSHAIALAIGIPESRVEKIREGIRTYRQAKRGK